MAAASQYYRVTAYVGTPHRNAVEVTIPLVGPAGPAGPAGTGLETLTTQGDLLYQGASVGQRLPIGTSGQVLKVSNGIPAWDDDVDLGQINAEVVNVTDELSILGETGIFFANSDGRENTIASLALAPNDIGAMPVSTATMNITGSTEQVPNLFSVAQGSYTKTVGGINFLNLVLTLNAQGIGQNYALIYFPPNLAKNDYAKITVMPKVTTPVTQEVYFKVLNEDTEEQLYPASGYSGLTALDGGLYHSYTFFWTGMRWDIELRPSPFTNDQIVRECFKPVQGGELVSWGYGLGGRAVPSTPTSTGTRGEVAVGTDIRDGIERFYICIATNTWRRVPIASW